jgi:cell division protease FtsH
VNSTVKTAVFWVVMLCTAILLWQVVRTGKGPGEKQFNYSEFRQQVLEGRVSSVTVTNGAEVEGKLSDNTTFKVTIPRGYEKILELLEEQKVVTSFQDSSTPAWASLLLNASPFLLLVVFWLFMMRQMQAGGNKALSFGKSRARLLTSQQKKVTFKDVSGVDEAKEELHEVIEFLREPQKFQKLGGRIPKGVLLVGPPGTGKTLLARAVAGEANVPFFSISGSDFVEMFVGVGASRVRDLFEQGKKALRASSSSTKSTPSDAIAAPGWAAAMTSASRR